MAFKRHFARVCAAELCTESIFTDHQRQVCDYALVYAEKKNDGDAPYSVSWVVRCLFVSFFTRDALPTPVPLCP